LIQEREHGQGWYLRAGRVEADETLAEAAVRETMEEASVCVVLDVEHEPLAHPAGNDHPENRPDEQSLGAWFTRGLRFNPAARSAILPV